MLKRAYSVLPVGLKIGVRHVLDTLAMDRVLKAEQLNLVRAAAHLSEQCLEGIRTLEDWQRQRPISRQRLGWMLGVDPSRERTSLDAEVSGVVEQSHCRIEKIVLESLPGLQVTANFYVPHDRPSRLPCIVYLNGHSTTLDGAKTAHQTPSLWYPANGFALLVVDPLGFGEIPGIHAGTHRLNWWHWLSLGYTPAGVEVWNAMRALDWLETRPEIDATRIGVTGLSGGGVMTQYLAAMDDRVAVAAPSCSTYTIGTQAALGLVPRQCDCTFYPNVFHMDFPEVLALIAPRPLMILGGRNDPIFPPIGFHRAYERVKPIYDLYAGEGTTDPRLRVVETDAGHTDTPSSLVTTHEWMCRWLRDRDGAVAPVEREGLALEPPEVLRCMPGVPASALNYHIHDAWIPPPALVCPACPADWDRRKQVLMDALQTHIFGWFPQAEIPFRTRRLRYKGGYAAKFADFGAYAFDSEPGVPVRAYLLRPPGKEGPVPLVVWIKGPADHVHFPDMDEFHPLLRTHALLIVTPRFALRPLSGKDYARFERTAALTGRSVAALRVWDVLRAVDWVTRDRLLPTAAIAVYGSGQLGIVGLYAAVMDPAIGHVVMRNPPMSHLKGPALLTVLRDTDIEEVAGLLAPRRLTLLSARQEGFALTRAIFDLVGVPESFRSAASLPEALFEEDVSGPDANDNKVEPC